MGTASAALISAAVRWRMNTGLPRHCTVIAWPSLIGARSTSVDDSASAPASGFICDTNGHSDTAPPTAANAGPASARKSRRLLLSS